MTIQTCSYILVPLEWKWRQAKGKSESPRNLSKGKNNQCEYLANSGIWMYMSIPTPEVPRALISCPQAIPLFKRNSWRKDNKKERFSGMEMPLWSCTQLVHIKGHENQFSGRLGAGSVMRLFPPMLSPHKKASSTQKCPLWKVQSLICISTFIWNLEKFFKNLDFQVPLTGFWIYTWVFGNMHF